MAAPSPQTPFYENEWNETLWVWMSQAFEDFCGDDPDQYEDREKRFKQVLNDVIARLEGRD